MAWRGVHLTEPARLSLADAQLVVTRADDEVRLAIEDIAWIVVDTPQATMTSALVSACMNAGVAMVITDASHTPSGLLLPFHRHHRQAAVAAIQGAATLPLRKRLWQRIVTAKIENQAACLIACGRDPGGLPAMALRVGSGDPDNIEAQAARDYFGRLFKRFVRHGENDRRNGLLDYGYAVVRAAVARALVAAGLLPAIGIHHASMVNPFNLADDVVEPFRPFVDRLVWSLSESGSAANGKLSVGDRRRLAALPTGSVRIGHEVVSLLTATEMAADSLVRAMEAGSPALLRLPSLL